MVNYQITRAQFNSLLNDQILDMTKLKAFAKDKLNVAQIMISVFDRVEDIVRKGENAGSHCIFQRLLSQDCVVKS